MSQGADFYLMPEDLIATVPEQITDPDMGGRYLSWRGKKGKTSRRGQCKTHTPIMKRLRAL
jgi:hypothetical protein